MLTLTLIAAGAMLIPASPALAQPSPGQARGMGALDTNADGKVTLSEFQAGRGGQMMAHLDSNKDGRLSKDEFSARPRKGQAEGRPGKGADRMWSGLDADSDGFASRAEMDSLLANRFKRMDTDNDGVLTMAELQTGPGRAQVGI